MGLKATILTILVAIGMFLLLKPTDVVLTDSIFIYRDPDYVYKKVSDIEMNLKYQKYAEKGVLKETIVKDNGVKADVYEVTEIIPVMFFNSKFTLVFDSTFEYTKPGRELNIYYYIWYARVSGHVTRKLTPQVQEGGPGSLIEQRMVITTPWITSHYILHHAESAHKDSLHHMKLTIESIHEYFNERKE